MKLACKKSLDYLVSNPLVFYISFFTIMMISYTPLGLFSNTLGGLIYRCVGLIILLPYIVYDIYKNAKILPKHLIFVIAIFMLFSLVNLATSHLKTNANIAFIDYFLSISESVIIPVSIVIFYIDIKKERLSYKSLYLLVAFGVLLITISFVIDWNSICNLFLKNDHSNYDIKSIFVDKNTFGVVLFLCSIVSSILAIKKTNVFLLFQMLFTLYTLLIRCKTAALLSTILSLILFCYYFYRQIKTKSAAGLIIATTIIIAFVVLMILTLFKISIFASVYEVVFGDYGLVYDAKVVVIDRFSFWNSVVASHMNALIWVFGFGQRIAYLAIGRPVDNVYLFVVLNGGIFEFVFYIYWLVLMFLLFLKGFRNIKIKALFIIVFVSILLYGLMEDFPIWGFSLPTFCYYLCLLSFNTLKESKTLIS